MVTKFKINAKNRILLFLLWSQDGPYRKYGYRNKHDLSDRKHVDVVYLHGFVVFYFDIYFQNKSLCFIQCLRPRLQKSFRNYIEIA
jgi:hypothetical protein